ncbi:MAG: UDP-3-O-(3-hydroxymyristoyl)glucosamine N-acyltransferase [Planctomycetes bacterium]|nr:UDP-3-O-(3-hydroxymyristoyl)glucosamine N-acyltransferase [Planctomycetota bacterium]
MKQMTVNELAGLLGGRVEGDGQKIIRGVGPLDCAKGDELAFLANVRYEKHLATTGAAAILVGDDFKGGVSSGAALVYCKDPYFSFRQAMVEFYGFRQAEFAGVDSRANIDQTAKLAEGVRVAAFATVARGSTIGPRTAVYPGVYIGPNCRIGADCTLYPNVVLYDGTIMGDRVTIHAGSSIGHDGFGYATHKGVHEKIPTAGWVEIGDDVELGACCTIDRAAMGPTVIGPGTKFSNLIAIGHGTKMGKGCLMVAQSGLAGSVTCGDYCVFAGQAGVVGHVHIGDGVRVGAQSGVTNDIPAGKEVLGSPAIDLSEARRNYILITQLSEMRKKLNRMEKEMEHLKGMASEKTTSKPEDKGHFKGTVPEKTSSRPEGSAESSRGRKPPEKGKRKN